MSQLRKDLGNQIIRRLDTWLLDSSNLYMMADLPQREAFMDIFTALVSLTGRMASIAKIDADDIKACIDLSIKFYAERREKSK
jgi:hypothetical protein